MMGILSPSHKYLSIDMSDTWALLPNSAADRLGSDGRMRLSLGDQSRRRVARESSPTSETANSCTFSRPVSRVSALDTADRDFHIDIDG